MRNSIIILVFAAVLILFSGCGRNKEISLTPQMPDMEMQT